MVRYDGICCDAVDCVCGGDVVDGVEISVSGAGVGFGAHFRHCVHGSGVDLPGLFLPARQHRTTILHGTDLDHRDLPIAGCSVVVCVQIMAAE